MWKIDFDVRYHLRNNKKITFVRYIHYLMRGEREIRKEREIRNKLEEGIVVVQVQ